MKGIAIAVFWALVKQLAVPVIILCSIEFFFLLLGIEIGMYADLSKEQSEQ